jgi:hypothetical protein
MRKLLDERANVLSAVNVEPERELAPLLRIQFL